MADDSNNVTIVLKLDDNDLADKVKKHESMFSSLEETMGGAFSKSIMGVISFNQALELASKAIEGIEAALKTMETTENWKNQETALKNLGQTLGVNVDLVLKAIKNSSEGTVTGVEAVTTAFKLLSNGVSAENIPQFVEIAHKLEMASGGAKTFQDAIEAMGNSVRKGTTRDLQGFGVALDRAGTHASIQTTILEQLGGKVEDLGTGYDSFAKRLSTSMGDMWNNFKRSSGEALTSVAFKVYANDAEKAEAAVAGLKKQLAQLEVQEAKGYTVTMMMVDGTLQTVEIDKARVALKEKIAAATEKAHAEIAKEKSATDELNKSITQQVAARLPLTQEEKAYADIMAKQSAARQIMATEEVQFGQASIKTIQQVTAAQAAALNKELAERRNEESSKLQSKEQLIKKLTALEVEYAAKLKALRLDDDKTVKAQQDGELAYVNANWGKIDGLAQRYHTIATARENKVYQEQIEKIRSSAISAEQKMKEIEAAESAHQQRLANIRKQFDSINAKNFEIGWKGALADIDKQIGTFDEVVNRQTKKTQGVMVNSFVEAAKGHGDAMQLMKQQFLENIGTEMIQRGTLMFLSSIWPPQPPGLAAGAALIAAGSAIVGASAAGGADTSSAGGGSAGSTTQTNTPTQATQGQLSQKSAQIVIQGDFLNSRETANHLADVLRSNSDVTDFSITAQGRNYGA